MITTLACRPGHTEGLAGEGAAFRHVAIKAGHVAERHHNDFEQFLYVASGHGRLQCEAGTIRLDPGTALHLPAGAWFSAEFMADTVLIETSLPPALSQPGSAATPKA